MAEHTDLVPDPRKIRTSRRLNLADKLKPATGITLTGNRDLLVNEFCRFAHHATSR
jgi:hypothetical protein